MEQLLPCRTCGYKPELEAIYDEEAGCYWHYVVCRNCGKNTNKFVIEHLAIDEWNGIANPVSDKPTRASILDEAKRIVTTDRAQQYGSAEDNFGRIAMLWSTYKDHYFTKEDVAVMMALLKIARIAGGNFKADSYIDACGYLSIAGEIGGKQ